MLVLAVLRRPHVTRLLAATLLGRLPQGTAVLALALLLRSAGAGYGVVAMTAAVHAAGMACGGPGLGRLIDRVGQTVPLLASAGVCAVGFALCALAPTSTSVVIVGAGLAGVAMPPLEPSLRALWPDLTAPEETEAAYALDSGSQELIYVAGPLVATASASFLGPAAGLWVCAATAVVGTVLVAASGPSRRWRAPRREVDWWGRCATDRSWWPWRPPRPSGRRSAC